MRVAPHLVAAIAGAMALSASAASAQAIAVQLTSLGTRSNPNLTNLETQNGVPISYDECLNAMIGLRFTGVDNMRSNLHFYRGTDCDQTSVRTDTNNTSCEDLEDETAIQGTQVDVSVPLATLLGDEGTCVDGTSGIVTVWALAIDQPASEVTGAGQQVAFPIAYDFSGPGGPANFQANDGESAATLTWTASSEEVLNYEVYLVPGGCSGGVVTTADLSEDAPNSAYLVDDEVGGTASSTTVSLPADDPVGSEYAVGLRAVDQAGNNGPLVSACVAKIEVQTWFDDFCGSGGSADACGGGDGCAAAPGPGRGGGLGLALAALAGALWWRRRRP